MTGLAGAVLAGGQSRRMAGSDKSFAPLAESSLISHVIHRLQPQVERLFLSVDRHRPALDSFGLEQVTDPAGNLGPLAGLLSSLEAAAETHEWLVLAPCDAPFLPRSLGQELLKTAVSQSAHGALIRYQGHPQPTFSLWNHQLLPVLRQAVQEKSLRGFMQFLDYHPLPQLDWPESEPSPFFNINDPRALREAEHWLSREASGESLQ